MSLIVKIILLELASLLSGLPADKIQNFVNLHVSLNSTFQLINDISTDLQKLLKYFSGTILAFFEIPFVPSATVFTNNLALYLKDLKLLVFIISALKLAASSSE